MNILERLNIAILLVTISYIIAIENLLSGIDQIQPEVRWFITFLTSVGIFRILILFVYWLVRNSNVLLSVYLRNRYLRGLWTYSYENDGQQHIGVWRVAQDISTISITGYGVDVNGKIDSNFRSISQIFKHQGADEIMFARTDLASGDEHFTKTTLYVDAASRPNWFSGPRTIRAQSVLYGFEEGGARHADIALSKAPKGLSETEIVTEALRKLPPGSASDPTSA